jgi:hypothetical protein
VTGRDFVVKGNKMINEVEQHKNFVHVLEKKKSFPPLLYKIIQQNNKMKCAIGLAEQNVKRVGFIPTFSTNNKYNLQLLLSKNHDDAMLLLRNRVDDALVMMILQGV